MTTPTSPADPAQFSDSPPPPAPVRALALLGAAGAALAGLAAVGCGWRLAAEPMPAVIGFGAISVLAGAFGVRTATAKRPDAPGIALLCVAGAAAVSATFINVNTVGFLLGSRGGLRWADPVTLAMFAAAGVSGLAAALTVLGRTAASWRRLAIGLALLAPVLLTAAAALAPGLRPGNAASPAAGFDLFGLLTPWQGQAEALRLLLVLGLAAVAVGLVSAGGHFVIRAFEAEDDANSPVKPSPSVKPSPAAPAPAAATPARTA